MGKLIKIQIIIAITGVIFLSACGGQQTEPQNTQPPVAEAELTDGLADGLAAGQEAEISAVDKITEDRAGNPINIPDKIERIISTSPANTQTLVALGLGDKIVAVDEFSAQIEGIGADLPKFDIMNPDTERIIALAPDMIFATGMSMESGENPFKPITDAGICLAYIPAPTSIAGIKEDILFLGHATNTTEKAGAIVAEMEHEISRIQEIGNTITNKKTVYFEISAAPYLYSFGKNVYLNEMIELIGAKNIFAELDSWASVSEEAVLVKNPDVIMTNVNYIDNPVDEILGRNGWDAIKAVKNAQVYSIDTDSSSQPNENIVKALNEMVEAVYPDKFN